MPFIEEVPLLLVEREMSIRALAREVGISDAHLSRVLAQRKPVGGDLARRVALALGLAPDYFPEFRKSVVVERLKDDAGLRDEIYERVKGPKRRARRRP